MSDYDDIWKSISGNAKGPAPAPSSYDDVFSAVTPKASATDGASVAHNGAKPTAHSAAYMEGRKETDRANLVPTRVLGTFLDGVTFGNGDEILGGIKGALDTVTQPGMKLSDLVTGKSKKTFSENYRDSRDYVRGVMDQYREDYPVSSMAAGVSASAPLIIANPVGKAGSSILAKVAPRAAAFMNPATQLSGVVPNTIRAGVTGAGYGALQGFGDSRSDDIPGLLGDTLIGAGAGGALSSAMYPLGSAVKSVISTGAQAIVPNVARDAARAKVAEAVSRDARGTLFTSGAADPTQQAISRITKMGPEATVADAAGENTRQLLDTLTTLPGQTKQSVQALVHDRQAGRAGRLIAAADTSLGTNGAGYQQTLDALNSTRKQAASPFYRQLEGLSIPVDDDVISLLSRTSGSHKEAQNLYRLQTSQAVKLSDIKKGDSIPFSMLDTLKQSLYDAADTAKRQGSNKMGMALDDVRSQLVNKLDDLAPKDAATGLSVYKMARDAYSGPSQMMDAAELGRKAMTADSFDVASAVKGMTDSESQAFRIGALQALREKVGMQSGQASLLKMWMEPTTQNRIKQIFGGEYRNFASEVAKETRLKGLEAVGKGSQTANRIYGAGDLDILPMVNGANAVASAASGSPVGVMSNIANAWNRVKTPEAVRDQMGQVLLSKGLKGTENLEQMRDLVRRINQNRASVAGRSGAAVGIGSAGLLDTFNRGGNGLLDN